MIDAHIHLDDERFDCNRNQVIEQAQSLGVDNFIVPAVMVSGFQKLKELSNIFPCIVPSYGLHPYHLKQHKKENIDYLDLWLSQNKSCAVGECGLDFFLEDLDVDIQQYYFEAQIAIAKKHNLPLVLHARKAVDAVFNSLKRADYFNAMIHSYNGSISQTKRLLDNGVAFSFGGAICNPRAHKLHKLIKYIPIDSIMFETDAPDQNLYPNYKGINMPANLLKIIDVYTELTGLKFKYVVKKSVENVKSLFHF